MAAVSLFLFNEKIPAEKVYKEHKCFGVFLAEIIDF